MKNFFKKIIIISFVFSSFFIFFTNTTKAGEGDKYITLAPLPETTNCSKEDIAKGKTDCETEIKVYIEGLFKLMIGIATIFTVGNIVRGGFEYITTDNIFGKSEGKNRIKNSLWGLALVICSWVVLYTINPNLIQNLDLNISPAETSAKFGEGGILTEGAAGPSPSGRLMTTEEVQESNKIKDELFKDSNIATYAGPCSTGQTTGCVNLNGLTSKLKDNLKSFSSTCQDCQIILTGGTEDGHSAGSSHYSGNAVDMRLTTGIQNFVDRNKQGSPEQTSLGPRYIVNINGNRMIFLRESDHWHVQNI